MAYATSVSLLSAPGMASAYGDRLAQQSWSTRGLYNTGYVPTMDAYRGMTDLQRQNLDPTVAANLQRGMTNLGLAYTNAPAAAGGAAPMPGAAPGGAATPATTALAPAGGAAAATGVGAGGAMPSGAAATGGYGAPSQPGANIIGGALPFGGGGGNMITNSGSLAGLGASYNSAYNSALDMNRQNYQNILSGYQQTAQNQAKAQQAIQAGYGQLGADVQGTIQGVDASQRQAIQDAYAKQQGQEMQGLVSRGLGNTTVANAVSRGLALDKAKADIALSNQMAQLKAGYQSNIGLAGLGFANAANQQNTGWSGRQLDWMNSINAGYPDARAYAALAQQIGATQGGGGAMASRNINLGSRGGPSGGLVGPSPTGQFSGATAPNLSSGGGIPSPLGSMSGGGGGYGGGYGYGGGMRPPTTNTTQEFKLNGMPVSEATFSGFNAGTNDMWGTPLFTEATQTAPAGYGTFTGGFVPALAGLGGGVVTGLNEAYQQLLAQQPGQDRSYNWSGTSGSYVDPAFSVESAATVGGGGFGAGLNLNPWNATNQGYSFVDQFGYEPSFNQYGYTQEEMNALFPYEGGPVEAMYYD